MTETLRFIPFRSCTDRGWAEVWTIYVASFPPHERWREAAYAEAFADPRFEADGVWCDDELVGLLFFWKGGEFRYLEHLAVAPTMRNRRLGARILTAFCAGPERVILEIDPPEDDLSVRRRGFYERQGFVLNPYEYIHPSYCRPAHPHPLRLMSRPGPLSPDEARRFADFIRTVVLRYSDHPDSGLPRIR